MIVLQRQAPLVDPPRGHLPPFDELFTLTHFESTLAATGDLLWFVTYVVAIWVGFKHRTYALPLLAIALNVTWEFTYTVIFPSDDPLVFGLHAAWLLVDFVIVYQLFRFGRKERSRSFFRRHFPLIVTLTLIACVAFHVTHHRFTQQIALFPIDGGNGTAFLINLVMSVLFIGMLFDREDLHGLSPVVAWTKMLGTALISIANVMAFTSGGSRTFEFQFREAGTNAPWQAIVRGVRQLDLSFFYFLFLTIFVLDILYIVLLTQARRRRRLETGPADATEISTPPATA